MEDTVDRLRKRTLVRHGGESKYGWNLTESDSELHVVAAAAIETLRSQLAHWKTFAIHAEGEHAAWENTAAELEKELRRLRIAVVRAVPAMHSYASKNPKHHMNDTLQDPCGVHAWLADFGDWRAT